LYPFWPELVANSGAWQRESRVCPGIGRGPAISRQAALRLAARMRRAYPDMYPD